MVVPVQGLSVCKLVFHDKDKNLDSWTLEKILVILEFWVFSFCKCVYSLLSLLPHDHKLLDSGVIQSFGTS